MRALHSSHFGFSTWIFFGITFTFCNNLRIKIKIYFFIPLTTKAFASNTRNRFLLIENLKFQLRAEFFIEKVPVKDEVR